MRLAQWECLKLLHLYVTTVIILLKEFIENIGDNINCFNYYPIKA